MSEMVERVARAIGEVDTVFGYSIKLARLVDGESTYVLDIDGESMEFPSHAAASDVVEQRRNLILARAAIEAMREPTEAMVQAGMEEAAVDLPSEYRAMIDAALAPSQPQPESPNNG